MSSTYATRLHQTAVASGLTLPTIHGGGVALPGSMALRGSPAYAAVRQSVMNTIATAQRFRTDGAAGRALPGGLRLDAAAPPAVQAEQAYGMAVVHEHAQSAAWRAQQRGEQGAVARADALTTNMAEALTSYWTGVTEIPYMDLVAYSGALLRINRNAVDPFAEVYRWQEKDLVGVARAANSYSTMDIPMVAGPVLAEHEGTIVPALVGMETNVFDAGRQALARRNGAPDIDIAREKATACDRALKEFANYLWLYGDPVLGIDGFHHHPAVPTITLTGGPWSGKTAAQKAADLVTILNSIMNDSRGRLRDTRKLRILLPPTQMQDVQNLIVSAAGNVSVLRFWMENNNIKPDQVETIFDFAAANSQAWNGGPNMLTADVGAVIYQDGTDLDPQFILPRDVEIPAPPRQNGLSETTFYHMRVAGMVVRDAQRMRYIAGF